MEEISWIEMMENMQEIRLFCENHVRRRIEGAISSAQELDLLSRVELSAEKITPRAVCRGMGISKTMGSRLIKQLCEKGLLQKAACEYDGRSCYLVITSKGSEEVKKTYGYYLEPVYRLKRTLGEEDFALLTGLIRKANG